MNPKIRTKIQELSTLTPAEVAARMIELEAERDRLLEKVESQDETIRALADTISPIS